MSGPAEVSVKILFFAKARELVRCEEQSVTLEPRATARKLKFRLLERFPALNPIKDNVILAVNQEYVAGGDDAVIVLKNGDEIAVIPPLSGG